MFSNLEKASFDKDFFDNRFYFVLLLFGKYVFLAEMKKEGSGKSLLFKYNQKLQSSRKTIVCFNHDVSGYLKSTLNDLHTSFP